MRKATVSFLTVSTGVAALVGGLLLATFTTNCGGSTGTQRTGVAGTSGSAGTSGTGTGTAGTSGTAGTTGSGGSGAPYVCSSEQLLDCANPVALPDGHVTDFSNQEWSANAGKFCDASGLRGTIYGYSGSMTDADSGLMSAHGQMVDTTGGFFQLTLTAAPGDYAGGGIQFDHCVNASSFNAVRFTLAVASGSVAGCNLQAQIKTFEQQKNDQTPPGGCADSCFNFPAAPITDTLSTTPTTITIPLASFTSTVAVAAAPPQVVGLQWQINSGAPVTDGGAQPSCMVVLQVDNVAFVNQ